MAIKIQASQQIVVNYTATAVSLLALLFVYPIDLNESYGLAQFISMTGLMLMPFAAFGATSAVIKFYPEFESADQKKGYLANLLLITATAVAVFLGLIFLFKGQIMAALERWEFNTDLLSKYGAPLLVTTVFMVLGRVLTQHSANYKRITIPAFFNTLIPKVVLPVLVLLVIYAGMTHEQLVWAWTLTFGVIVIGLIFNLWWIGGLDLQWRPRDLTLPLLKRIASFSGFSALSTMGSMLANRVDVFMVTLLLGERINGAYVTVIVIAGILQFPTQAVWAITSPQLAKAWKDNDMHSIRELYQRSSQNLFVAGIVVFLVCLGNMDAVFSLTSNYEGLAAAIPAFAFLGIAKLLDMITSLNTQIIMYSKYYRYNALFVTILAVSNIILNYIFIRQYGMTGAALATAISVIVYNGMKSVFIYFKFGMMPFSKDVQPTIWMAIMSVSVFLIFPRLEHPLLHIAVFTPVMLLVCYALVEGLRINTDFLPYFKQKADGIVRSVVKGKND